MSISFFVNSRGTYMTQCDTEYGLTQGWIVVPSAPADARQSWDFEASSWNPLPGMTEQEMKDSEIAQDKQFLADTDWIVAKMGEASFTGQDVAPLLEQYADQLTERENARVRIRINEGRA